MRMIKIAVPVFSAVLLAACSNPADNVAQAGVSDAGDIDPAAQAVPGGKVFAFSQENSRIDWVGSKVTGRHDGGFRTFAGEFTVVDGRLANTGNKVVIDMTSVWSDNDRLTGHLKTADFFEVETYPTATFITSSVEQNAEGSTVTGNLTLHGVTKQISFPATVVVSEGEVRVNAEFVIDRFDFDVKYTGRADDLIRKEVVLKLDVRATPGRANFESFKEAPQVAAGPA